MFRKAPKGAVIPKRNKGMRRPPPRRPGATMAASLDRRPPPILRGDSSHLGGSRYYLRTVTRGYRHLLSPHSTMLIQESDRVLVKFLRSLHLHPVTHLREEHETHIGTLLQEVPRPLLWAELILDAPKS